MKCFQTGTGEFGAELGHPCGASQVRRQQAGATSKHENLTLHELVVSLFFQESVDSFVQSVTPNLTGDFESPSAACKRYSFQK